MMVRRMLLLIVEKQLAKKHPLLFIESSFKPISFKLLSLFYLKKDF